MQQKAAEIQYLTYTPETPAEVQQHTHKCIQMFAPNKGVLHAAGGGV